MTAAPSDPDLRAVVAAFVAARARFILIGGFAVVAHRHVRATEDVDLLIPDDSSNDGGCLVALASLDARTLSTGRAVEPEDLAGRAHLRAATRAGLVDLVREGDAPLDFDSALADALTADLGDGPFLVAGLATIVALKRLAGRPRDRQDLDALAEEHGTLPMLELPDDDEGDAE